MGQKIHPGGLRVGVIHDWKSNWYTGKKEFADYIIEDVRIREHITGKLAHAGLSDILIRKDKQRITVDIYTARPGIVIGKSGVEVERAPEPSPPAPEPEPQAEEKPERKPAARKAAAPKRKAPAKNKEEEATT